MADEHVPATDPRMAAVVAVLLAVLVGVVALAAGLSWERLLHFAGVVLLLAGILAAAKGIRDVRLPARGGQLLSWGLAQELGMGDAYRRFRNSTVHKLCRLVGG